MSARPARQFLIVTADDFGLHRDINAAVERAHREGILNAASLMVGAAATDDAVLCAQRCPALRVGLHLVLADGYATLPWERIPDLVDIDGRFGDDMVRAGIRFFLLPEIRRQLAAEIRAQFEAYARTGLPLDHVNAHKHFHLHPTVQSLILRIGRDFGLRAMRVPREAGGPLFLRPWLALLRRRLRREDIACNDYILGLSGSGDMDEATVLAALERLPGGVVEMYLHPATHSGAQIAASMPQYRHADELAALLSPRVRALADRVAPRRGSFADLRATAS